MKILSFYTTFSSYFPGHGLVFKEIVSPGVMAGLNKFPAPRLRYALRSKGPRVSVGPVTVVDIEDTIDDLHF